MLNQRLGVEAEELGIGADHLERLAALRQAGHVAQFDRFEVIGMDARSLARLLEAQAPRFALMLEIPAGLASGIGLAIGLLADLDRLPWSASPA